jgi:hypothetical protein
LVFSKRKEILAAVFPSNSDVKLNSLASGFCESYELTFIIFDSSKLIFESML